MMDNRAPAASYSTPARTSALDRRYCYQIRVEGMLSSQWAAWFEDFELFEDVGTTRIVGWISDQAELHGVLGRIRDLGLPLLSVERLPGEL
jgi:hypothetical protein